MARILVTGGAGYIGSFMTKRLLDEGYDVVVIDSLERGREEAVDPRAEFISGSILDKQFVSKVFSKSTFEGVIHFAGYISMGESMRVPGIYFENNVQGAIVLLEEMVKKGTKIFIFSSTAGVYGDPLVLPIPESHQKRPSNPYSESKLIVEQILSWYRKIYTLRYAALRYFNAAGASFDGKMGEAHSPETHIIPAAIHAALTGSKFCLYGTNYDTKDGTAVRDYIHVIDLVEAHILALRALQDAEGELIYNVGTGIGHSNKEVISLVKKETCIDFVVEEQKRRPGDAHTLISDPSRIKEELGFSPKYSSLETIVDTAWKWHKGRA